MSGKDEDYAGGTFLRAIDHGLQNIGISRDSNFMKWAHKQEHLRRARIAEREGDYERAAAERKRAESNNYND